MARNDARFPKWPIDERVFEALSEAYGVRYPDRRGGTTDLARQVKELARSRKGGKPPGLSHAAVQQLLSGSLKSSWCVPYLAEVLGVPLHRVIPEISRDEALAVEAVRMVVHDRPERAAAFVADFYQRALDITGRAYDTLDDEQQTSDTPRADETSATDRPR